MKCIVCGKAIDGIGFGCSEKCTKEILKVIKIITIAGEIMKIIEETEILTDRTAISSKKRPSRRGSNGLQRC